MQQNTMFPRKFVITSRLLLGLLFFVCGLNGFLHFLPPQEISEAAVQFIRALTQSTYIMPLVFATQLIASILLLTGRFVPLALVLLVPITVNIIGFHLTMDLNGIIPGAVATILQIYLLFAYFPSYKSLLQRKPERVPIKRSNR